MAEELAHTSMPTYRGLDHSKRQFRLVKLTSSGEGDPSCELSTFSLLQEDVPTYKALSYRWGNDRPTRTIHINGNPILVRQNLSFFLTQMMSEKRQDWFFIDAISIDQTNTTEKTQQVSQMGEIFRRADEVLAWIVYEPYHKDGDVVVFDPVDYTEDMMSKSRSWLESSALENSYWTRLWVLQEVLLAKRLTIRMGNAEIEWRNLIPEKTPLTSRGLPKKNNALGMNPFGNDLYANEKTAINILSYRRFETKSLRAGNHIPFHQAFDFFSLHYCSDLHDKVFGYIGLTNSRIQVDYSMPILDLFISVLADFFMSTGLLGEDLTPLRKKMQYLRTTMTMSQANDLIVPFLAFDLNPFDPVIFTLFWEVSKFFAPGYEEGITTTAVTTWWYLKRGSFQADIEALVADATWEFKYIGSACIKVVKLLANEHSEYMKVYKATVKQHKDYTKSNPMLTCSDGSETKTYSEWNQHARSISDKLWQRFLDAGEEDAGELDDESWNLIG